MNALLLTISRNAEKILIGLFSVILIFHVCIILKIIPYNITWGGRLNSEAEMYVFESISIGTIIPLYMALFIRTKRINVKVPPTVVTLVLWFYLIVFSLNTVGNMFAETTIEKTFAFLTLAIALLLGLVLKKKT